MIAYDISRSFLLHIFIGKVMAMSERENRPRALSRNGNGKMNTANLCREGKKASYNIEINQKQQSNGVV